MLHDTAIGIRWTVGDISDDGFEALRLSTWGAWRVFGARAAYSIGVHDVAIAQAQAKTGAVPDAVRWQALERTLPDCLVDRIGTELEARDVGWKFVPVRRFPERFEISLDNDCILWELPVAIASWIDEAHPTRCLVAEDVRLCSGRFLVDCPDPRNACIRGLPPGFDLEAALADELARVPGALGSELDELGLQIAAVSRHEPPCVVPIADVTICSPFPPHHLALGRCGAHFVGINNKQLAKSNHDQSGTEHLREHWRRHRLRLHELVGLAPAEPTTGSGPRAGVPA